jgi:hypothetical protein
MEEQVIQTPVAPEPQPVAGADTAQPTLDVSGIKAEYESQINALKVQAAEADERFQGIKAKLDEVYKKQDDQGKISGRKPTKPPKKKTRRSPNSTANWRTFARLTKPQQCAQRRCRLSAKLAQLTPSKC